jgi:hypothetical protein
MEGNSMTEQFFTTEDGVRRPATESEIETVLIAREKAAKREADKVAKATAKAELLARLGITEDEARLLLS